MDHLEGNPLEEHTRVMAQFVATYTISMVVVVAQLVERSLPIPEVRGSSPVISKMIKNSV